MCWRCSRMCRRPSLPATAFDGEGIGVVDLVARVQLAPSKSEARRLVQSGGVYVNNRRVADPQARITREPGDRRPVVRVAEGAEAESSGPADLTAPDPVRDTARHVRYAWSAICRAFQAQQFQTSGVHPSSARISVVFAMFGLTGSRNVLVTLEGSPKSGRPTGSAASGRGRAPIGKAFRAPRAHGSVGSLKTR